MRPGRSRPSPRRRRRFDDNLCYQGAPSRAQSNSGATVQGKEVPMLHNPPLLTINRGHRRPEKALVEAFRGAQTSHLCDAMDGRGALDYRIKPLDPGNAVFVGPALTAYAYPADSVGMFGALAEAAPGDVLVVACDGFTGTAVVGDLAAGMMK